MAQSAENITSRMHESEEDLQHATTALRELDKVAQGLQSKFSAFRT
jgi:methyl-accepting chemotaxis protein